MVELEGFQGNLGESEDESGLVNMKEDFRQCGLEIQNLLLDGEEISDALYVRLFVTKLRLTYKYKTPDTLRQEIIESARLKVELTA
jgi:hypothetical protein